MKMLDGKNGLTCTLTEENIKNILIRHISEKFLNDRTGRFSIDLDDVKFVFGESATHGAWLKGADVKVRLTKPEVES